MKAFSLRQGVWTNESIQNYYVPDTWQINTLSMDGAPSLSKDEMRHALQHPIGVPAISELALQAKTALIVSEDHTRPLPCDILVELILEELETGGIPCDRVRILIANGTHRPMTRRELIQKFGLDICNKIQILAHNCYGSMTHLGETTFGTPIWINSELSRTDLIIGLGGIYPHGMAGFSGGAKIILPGAAGFESILHNHSRLAGQYCQTTHNDIRQDMEEAAKAAGLNFIINGLVNEQREICGLFAGDFIQAHRAGCTRALEVYHTSVKGTADVLVLNAYPMDTELFQAAKVLEHLKRYQSKTLTVLIAQCDDGFGYHALCGYGGPLHEKELATVQKTLGNVQLIVVSENVHSRDLNLKFPKNVTLCKTWNEAVKVIAQKCGDLKVRVKILPASPLQILDLKED